ncbi:acetylesterase [Bifidobacterium goeldii]|uniref:Acetylesterase n=1 Tax=Bifidobacterium goeldii TaxID=2306975 RepID=A0A430FNK5_9BIFI|nr:alpha/beta hydrolase [Bifidobacterium goeldii]RSX54394.1 acetylesterase [Bifidobacterium goeldii]
MQYIDQTITGVDGSEARFVGYVLDNSEEIDPDRHRPAVLVIPGGGYQMTSDREAEPVAMKFVAAGYQAFALRYSCAPSVYPTALLEAAQAMTLIRDHADEWHVDVNRVAAIGFSAGGHLAANLATSVGDDDLAAAGYDPDAVRPNALMLAYPVITAGEFAHRGSFDALLGATRKDDAEWLDKLSIEQHIDAKTPPVFVWHTMTDMDVPVENTLMLIAACRAAGASIEAHLFPEGGHGTALGNEETAVRNNPAATIVPCVQIWPKLAVDWLKRTFAA